MIFSEENGRRPSAKQRQPGSFADLGDGYTGVISSGDMDWARHTSKYVGINRKGRIAIEGDVIWVSAVENKKPVAHKEKVQPDKKKGKDKEAAAPEPEYVPGNTMGLKRGVAIPLRLQQEPLVQGALVSIEPQSGDVVALIGGYQFGNSHFNRATQARRQPGSSFKPVVYSAALDNGFTPTSPVLDAPFEYVDPYTHKVWRPGNFEHSYKGEMPLHLALAQSRNIPTVRLCKAIGVDKVIERAKQLGIEPDFPRNLTISLGAVALSPLNLTQAYAAFANGGLGVRPRIITSIKDASGKEIPRQDPEHWVAVTPQNAYQIDMLLQEVVNRGTGSRARIEGRHVDAARPARQQRHERRLVHRLHALPVHGRLRRLRPDALSRKPGTGRPYSGTHFPELPRQS